MFTFTFHLHLIADLRQFDVETARTRGHGGGHRALAVDDPPQVSVGAAELLRHGTDAHDPNTSLFLQRHFAPPSFVDVAAFIRRSTMLVSFI